MKGVILAGGQGTRLHPLTRITNKHLLPVYDQPMIMYPLGTLKKSGIREVMIVCGKEHAGHFMHFLGSGRDLGLQISYALQDKPSGGIADALSYAEAFAEGMPLAIILGDNIFEEDFSKEVKNFKGGATGLFKKVADPSRFGVPVFEKRGKRVLRIEEKPKRPKSRYAQTGFYIVDASAFDLIRTLKPSARGELEMTDLLNQYVEKHEFSAAYVKGRWLDAGTIESLFEAATVVRRWKKHG